MPQPAGAAHDDDATPRLVGRFSYRPASGVWEWDETTSRLHGLEAGRRSVTTDLLLELVHPDDRETVAAFSKDVSDRFRLRYRVPTTEDAARQLLLVGHLARRAPDDPCAEGHAVDIAADLQAAGEHASREAVEAVMVGHGAIEQAKGVLMLAYGLTQDEAFAMLRWWSRNHNIRVRLLAERLMARVYDVRSSREELLVAFDRVLHDLAIAPDTP